MKNRSKRKKTGRRRAAVTEKKTYKKTEQKDEYNVGNEEVRRNYKKKCR